MNNLESSHLEKDEIEKQAEVIPLTREAKPTTKQVDRTTESLDTQTYLDSFQNEISPSSIMSIEKRPDDAVIMHCNNLYEYLKFGYRDDPRQVAQIEKFKDIFEAFSKPESIPAAIQHTRELAEKDQNWVMDKLNAEGSAVSVQFKDGKIGSIVIMNDMPTRRMFNRDGSRRNEAQTAEYDKAYARTVEHEVRHTQYYNRYGKDLEAWRESMEGLKPLTPFEQRKWQYDRFMKDEIVAHIENEVIEQDGKLQVNWEGIVENLQKDDYRFPEVFKSQTDKEEYLLVSRALVNKTKEELEQGKPALTIMETIANIDVRDFMNTKSEKLAS